MVSTAFDGITETDGPNQLEAIPRPLERKSWMLITLLLLVGGW